MTSEPPEVELQVTVRCHVGSGNQIGIQTVLLLIELSFQAPEWPRMSHVSLASLQFTV